jgi:hypothetical protein
LAVGRGAEAGFSVDRLIMGTFQRSGTFVNREKFLEGVKQKLEKLLGGAAQGMTATWEKQGAEDVGRLAGFGAKIEITVGENNWACLADIPSWIPIPLSMIEQKFDQKFAELSKL